MTRYWLAGMVFAVGVGGPVAADDAALKALAGAYTVTAATKDGKAVPADILDGFKAKLAGDELTFTVKGKEFPAKIKVDPTKSPAHLDISPAEGTDKGRTFPGVYGMEKGELVIAFSEHGERPTDLKGGPEVLVVRLKRDGGK